MYLYHFCIESLDTIDQLNIEFSIATSIVTKVKHLQ